MMLRHRISLLEQRNEVHNQIRDLFETANLKLSSVITDLMGGALESLRHDRDRRGGLCAAGGRFRGEARRSAR
jgi:predicted site-specific integrase-resolvase